MAHALTGRPEIDPETAMESPLGIAMRLAAFISSGFKAPATLENKIEVNR
jgi:hypothetical protein